MLRMVLHGTRQHDALHVLGQDPRRRQAGDLHLAGRAQPVEIRAGCSPAADRVDDEPHADASEYRRLHVIVGDTNLSEHTHLLRFGATDLLHGLVSAGAGLGLPLAIGRPQVAGSVIPGQETEGHKRVKFHQLQATATKSFGPQLKASQLVAALEAGYTYMDLPKSINGNPIRFNGPGLDTPALVQGRGFATNNSYGYRLVTRADYNNALGPINLSPRLAFSHDLRGISPTFVQGVQAATIGVGASYQTNWQADLSYTNYFGGETYRVGGTKTTNNPLSDRDFIAATVSYSF